MADVPFPKIPVLTSIGYCDCICEPKGDFGMEGFQLNERYVFHEFEKHYAIFPAVNRRYSEGIPKRTFKRYFRIMSQLYDNRRSNNEC